ncbi:recombinase family protein [Rummeliibacillus sp. SL167]|uniref:recombinase family protein n=1 Tax=Rummeliibacillus sp. SL167 TaxID=2579792 RepID=UPI001645E599
MYWHGSTVHQILERQIYTGCLVAKKTSQFLRQLTNVLLINQKTELYEKILMKQPLVKEISN